MCSERFRYHRGERLKVSSEELTVNPSGTKSDLDLDGFAKGLEYLGREDGGTY